MNDFWMYLLELNLVLVVLFGAYTLVKSFIDYRLSRWCLLMLPILSVVLVWIKSVLIASGNSVGVGLIQLDEVVVNNQGSFSDGIFNWSQLYWIGVTGFMLFSAIKLLRIRKLFKGAKPHSDYEHIKVISTNSKDSFSFFNRIHLSAHLKEEEKEVVLDHELLHASNYHSLDLLLMEIYHAFFWFNPLLLIMKKELIQVHEFEVDQAMYSKYNVGYLKHLVAYALGASSAHLLLTSQFYNKLTLAKRITKMKSKRRNRNFMLALIPVIGLTFASISWSQVDQTKKDAKLSYAIPPPNGSIDKEPQFKGGKDALFAYIGEHIKYPENCEKNNTQGTVHVEFTVLTDGSVQDAKIKKSAHKDLDAAALQVVQGMPKWEPGMKDGKPVKTQMVLPITFKL